jgi:AcrR family transcriptional regulator
LPVKSGVPDPRIERTHTHVLDVVRRILSTPTSEPLTFTLLAREAQVSRRTLYVHWGTIDRVLSEAASDSLDESVEAWPVATYDRLVKFLTQLRDSSGEPVAKAALSSLMSLATHDPAAAKTLTDLTVSRIALFTFLIAPITAEQYAELVGPIYFIQFATRKPVSDALLDSLIARGAAMLGIESGATPLGEAA